MPIFVPSNEPGLTERTNQADHDGLLMMRHLFSAFLSALREKKTMSELLTARIKESINTVTIF